VGSTLRLVVGSAVLIQALACGGGGGGADGPGAGNGTATGSATGTQNSGSPHDTPVGAAPTDSSPDAAAPAAPLAAGCDDDNPVSGTTDGTVDRPLPDEIVQFERKLGWNCTHREYHETRQWDFLVATKAADLVAYMQKQGWTRAAVQEGEPGSGLDFLAMHRAMVRTLRDRFPAHADLFAGWTSVPTVSTTDDPLPTLHNSIAASAFWDSMNTAISRVQTNPTSFASDDELGLYIETQHRPVAGDPLARSTEPGAGLHTYVHVRFDDDRSPIRMQRFSRNLENQTFFRLHGWVDAVWTAWRKSRGLDDTTDATYLAAMNHACMHMGLMEWEVATAACMRM
jgi:hypothetical protein